MSKVRVGVFNDAMVLTGEVKKEASKVSSKDIAIGDLPANSTYRWQDGQFIPVGHGYGKPRTPPVSADKALFLGLRAVHEGAPVPQECLDWMQWFEKWGN
ncbi:MAG TPA: hypothetical protein VFM75_11440 [Modicisalibacter sp.]|nr:hypothetical protein [Modicisalibacter sp.]